ncbi:hypothetical protein ACQP2Y_21595 [Actinoplanes sp. CA-051413]|uniref:hypothetical protein n=1 Tax=Actinoplanes sp. CA-051413 TaxID=3239899 RepID=UPI003D98C053
MTSPYTGGDRAYAMDSYARQLAMEALRLANTAGTTITQVTPSVGGPVTVPALSVGGSVAVVVPFAPAISGGYVPVPSLYGTTSLIGGLGIAGITAKTPTSVTVLVRADKLAVAAGASLSIVCFRTT